jgi:hypothetical protein
MLPASVCLARSGGLPGNQLRKKIRYLGKFAGNPPGVADKN